jgi:hypothetical protein
MDFLRLGLCSSNSNEIRKPAVGPLAGNRWSFLEDLDVNFPPRVFVQTSMQLAQEIGPETVERLEKQVRFLIRIYDADLAKDAASHATESSRSNLMAVQHTLRQTYGPVVARCVAKLA